MIASCVFKRHATSKISESQDLLQLTTKGFRGEAMASIASVAHVVLKTKQQNEELGIQTIIEGGKIISQKEIVSDHGCTISVENLFFNTPARRNFLKSDYNEYKHIVDEFLRVALSHKEISFTFNHNDKEIYQLKPSNLKVRLVQVFGKKVGANLFAINEKTTLMNLYGFVGKPEIAKKSRIHNYFFVNHRFVKIPYFHHAICTAFQGLISDAHPSYFLFLEVPPESIDVNVHPNKTQIKFSNEKTLYQMILSIVKRGLGKFNITPSLDFQKDNSVELPHSYKIKKTILPQISVDPEFNPFKQEDSSGEKNTTYPQKPTVLKDAKWESLYVEVAPPCPTAEKLPLEENEAILKSKTFQVYNKYILTTFKSEIILIHQNLAHQRILYEQFLERSTLKKIPSQKLLFPITLDFTPQEIQCLLELKKDLQILGFRFEAVDREKICIDGLPQNFNSNQILEILRNLITDFDGEKITEISPCERIAKSLAKSSAIKSGTQLTEAEQETLVHNLFLCQFPNRSPEGKKTIQRLDKKNIDHIFAREILN